MSAKRSEGFPPLGREQLAALLLGLGVKIVTVGVRIAGVIGSLKCGQDWTAELSRLQEELDGIVSRIYQVLEDESRGYGQDDEVPKV